MARIAGARVPITDGQIIGRKLSFTLGTASGAHAFEAEVFDGSARGMVKSGAQGATWGARRATKAR